MTITYAYRRLPSDRWNWSDESGVYERTREGYSLPSSQWQWSDEPWTVETKPNVTDKDGWQYAVDFPRFVACEKAVQLGITIEEVSFSFG